MNKQYRLTGDSKFATVMKAALEHHIEVSLRHDRNLVTIIPHDGIQPCGFEACKIEEAPIMLQDLIDELEQKGGQA